MTLGTGSVGTVLPSNVSISVIGFTAFAFRILGGGISFICGMDFIFRQGSLCSPGILLTHNPPAQLSKIAIVGVDVMPALFRA